jgi:hypothetical protein
MAKFSSAQMGSKKGAERRRPEALLWPDYHNSDPFIGLPDDLPSGHSRFPIEPSAGYGDLYFDPSLVQTSAKEKRDDVMTDDERRSWRLAMRRALGNLVAVRISGKRRS